MYTVAETTIFTSDAKSIWSEGERGEFCVWIAHKTHCPAMWFLAPEVAVKYVGRELAWVSAAE